MDMQDWNNMDVEEVDTVNGLPNLPCLKPPIKEEPVSDFLLPNPGHLLVYQSDSAPANALTIRLVNEHTASQLQPQRQQQYNQPMCPPNEDTLLSTDPDAEVDVDACPPRIVEFDESFAASLSADEIARILNQLPHSQQAPSVPEIFDPNSPSQLHLLLPPQPSSILEQTRPRQRNSDTITLISDREGSATPSSTGCNFEIENVEIMRQLMDDEASDDESGLKCCQQHIPIPSCNATSQEHRLYEQTAKFILTLHSAKSRDVLHAKKKPMLHEFLGYILFGSDHEELACLRGSVYFCRENGDRLTPMCQEKRHFRVANFPAVSEVWRMTKCNFSTDCIKNMKRAMRMSTTNGRNFFVNLSHRMHRMQIFQFGDRSLEFFKKAFPDYFTQGSR